MLGLGYAGIVLVLGQLSGGVDQRPAELGGGRRHPGGGRSVPTGPAPHPAAVDRRFNRASTTRPRRSRPSAPGCATRSTWTPCRPSCWRWSTRRCSRPRPRCGFGHRHEDCRVVKGEAAEPTPIQAMTPCMPCSFGLLPHPRSGAGAQPNGLLGVTVIVRWIPPVPAAYGTRVARPARTTMLDLAATAPSSTWRVRPDPGDHRLVGKSPEGSRQPGGETRTPYRPRASYEVTGS